MPSLMLRLSIFTLVLFAAALRATAASDTISASVAALYLGQEKTVEGKVTSIERDANVVKLHLGEKQPRMTVSIVVPWVSRFPNDPETYYLNRVVRVTGVIEQFRQQFEITVREPQQIVLDSSSEVATGAAPVQDLKQRYDVLNQRVQQLEQKLEKGGSDE